MDTVCQVCMHHCSLKPGQRGICRARKNEGGRIQCDNYGRVTSLNLDPIEKKPLRMFCPGSLVLSVGSYGCNLRCSFCQNHEISMTDGDTAVFRLLLPQELAERARYYQPVGNIGAAFTYNEPLVGWEYVRDAAERIHAYGMKNVMVTNGHASLSVLEELLPYVDAMNIDLKCFRKEGYKKLGGDLDTVKAFITRAAANCHVELTTLVVPGENDSLEEIEEEAAWIASVSRDIPLHITRFFPRYRMTDREATEVQQVYCLAKAAEKYVNYVFVGNC